VVNNGNTSIHLSNFSLTQPSIFQFSTGGSDTTISPGEAMAIDINCTVTNSSAVQGLLHFNSDASGFSSVNIPLYVNDPVFNYIETAEEKPIELYPNPASDYLRIRIPNENPDLRFEFYSPRGELLEDGLLENLAEHNNSRVLSLNKFADGIYLLRISGDGYSRSMLTVIRR